VSGSYFSQVNRVVVQGFQKEFHCSGGERDIWVDQVTQKADGHVVVPPVPNKSVVKFWTLI
jgi:hypothetical protein